VSAGGGLAVAAARNLSSLSKSSHLKTKYISIRTRNGQVLLRDFGFYKDFSCIRYNDGTDQWVEPECWRCSAISHIAEHWSSGILAHSAIETLVSLAFALF